MRNYLLELTKPALCLSVGTLSFVVYYLSTVHLVSHVVPDTVNA